MNFVSVLHRRDNTENKKFCSELINLSVKSGKSHQNNREFKRAAQSYSKLTDL